MADENSQRKIRWYHCAGPLSKDEEPIDDVKLANGRCHLSSETAFLCDANCPEVGKRAHVVAFPHWCATSCAGGAVPALAQLASSSYHAAVSSHSLPPSSQDDKIQNSRTSSTL